MTTIYCVVTFVGTGCKSRQNYQTDKLFFANTKILRTFAVGNNPKDSNTKTANNGNLSNIATAKDVDKFT